MLMLHVKMVDRATMSPLVGYKRAKRKVVVQAFAILAIPKFA